MWQYIQAAGPIAWPLMALSLVSVTFIFERAIFWMRQAHHKDQPRVDQFLEAIEQDKPEEAAKLAQGNKDPVLRTLHCGLVHREWSLSQAMAQQATDELSRMRKFLTLLDTVITAAPLLGILGTVTGIIGAFQILGATGIPDPKQVTGGIAEALITTVFGLTIALYTLFPFNYFTRKVEDARVRIEKYATSLEILFQRRQSQGLPLSQEKPSAQDRVPKDTGKGTLDHEGGVSDMERRFLMS